jgi:hypothetical protein
VCFGKEAAPHPSQEGTGLMMTTSMAKKVRQMSRITRIEQLADAVEMVEGEVSLASSLYFSKAPL